MGVESNASQFVLGPKIYENDMSKAYLTILLKDIIY